MKDWLTGALAYAYAAWMFFRICRRDHNSWRFTVALTAFGPLLLPIGILMAVGTRVRNLRHFTFKGFLDRQRKSILGDLAAFPPEGPDDGGFFT